MAHPKYIAHAESSSHRIQSLETHLKNVETLGIRNNPLPEIKNLVHLMLILHDAGKVSDDFQDYMEAVLKDSTVKRHVDHSSTGGKIIEGFDNMPLLSNIVANIIYMHHGLADCIDFKGVTLTERRDQSQIDFETIEEKFFEIFSASEIRSIAEEANKEVIALYDHIKKYAIKYIEINKTNDAKSVKISVAKFCIGMYTRLLLSILIDSDWTDAACFSDDIPLPERMTLQEVMQIWQRSSRHLNKRIQQFKKDDSIINAFRRKISDICYQKSIEPERIYRLTVPTGAGKTLSSLRFALNHAIKYKKQHIIYVAPYNSILEQNADEIRQAVGDKNIVLEHHSNVVISENESESEMNEKKYKRLTESWDMPIIATSAVQILNTLFSSKKECIRRMYNLCNSIIVFDEVQAIPSKCSNLFNLAVNWLSECCHTTVVLCSATQPSLAGNQTYNVLAAEEMAGDPESYTKLFQRVEIHDKTSYKPGGMEVNDVIELISDSMQEYQSVLMIVNTKKAALSIFQAVNKKYEGTDTAVIHLSTFMCPKHRKEKIDLIKQYLNDHKKIICISTQIIEAGVNLSFGCVIRSLAGLDNILQAAGRCNRDGKMDKKGRVYIIKLSCDLENVARLQEINQAQKACEKLLSCTDDKDLDTQTAIKKYYEYYNLQIGPDGKEFITKEGEHLTDLLGRNKSRISLYRSCHTDSETKAINHLWVQQAFKTAGECFQVIDDYNKTVIIPYNQEAEDLIRQLETTYTISEKKKIIRKLQKYTVGLSPRQFVDLGCLSNEINETGIYKLSKVFYNNETGVVDNPFSVFLMD